MTRRASKPSANLRVHRLTGPRGGEAWPRCRGMVTLVGVTLLTGCSFANVLGREDSRELTAAESVDDALDGEDLVSYLDMMRRLVEGDPLTQTDTFLDVAQSAAAWPTTRNRVMLALAVATPGHPNSDPQDAQQRLSNLLASGAALLPAERMLVSIHLKGVEQQLILDAEAQRLRQEAEAARTAQDDENERRLEAVLRENERLSRELQEAQQKLDAITNIERSIRERENGADP